MRDVTDAGVAWLVSSLPADAQEAAQWVAAPRSRRELPTGTVFDAVGVDSTWACGLLDRFVEYGFFGVPIAVVDSTLYVLVRPRSSTHVRGLTIEDQSGQPVAALLLGPGDHFTAPPLEIGADDHALWLVAPNGAPRLPLASLVLAALGSLPSPSLEATDMLRGLFGSRSLPKQEDLT